MNPQQLQTESSGFEMVAQQQQVQDEQGHVNEQMDQIEKSLEKQELEESKPIINLTAEGLESQGDRIEDNYDNEEFDQKN